MKHFTLLVFVSLLSYHCGQSPNIIEIKNAQGIVIEKYQIDADSLKQGEATTFDDDGNIFDKANYVNGTLSGKRTIYYQDGSTDTEENYVDGVLTGEYTQYYKNGNVMQRGSYTDGTLNGEVVTNFENGSKKESVTFKDNIEDGPFVEYYENGKKQWEGTYRNGDNEYGLLIEYDSLENVIKKMDCDTLGMCRTIWTKEEGDITPSF